MEVGMLPYPTEAVERIIGEALAHQDATGDRGRPYARERLVWLMFERLCAGWQKPKVRHALEVVAIVEAGLLEFGRQEPCILRVTAEDCASLVLALEGCQEAVAAVLEARAEWITAGIGPSDAIAEMLTSLGAVWARRREEVLRGLARRPSILVHTNVIDQIHEGLQNCYVLFMTGSEADEINLQLNRALAYLGDCKPLFKKGYGTQMQ